jgi:hypothetical protein
MIGSKGNVINPFACYFFLHMVHPEKLIFWQTRQYKSIYNLKIYTIGMLMHHSINAFFFSFKTIYDMSMPSTGRKLELKARHRRLSPSHSRVCIQLT